MNRPVLRFLALCIFACGCDGVFELEGVVTDTNGKGIQNATVSLKQNAKDGLLTIHSRTDSGGKFGATAAVAPNVDVFELDIGVSAPGYVPISCRLTLPVSSRNCMFVLQPVPENVDTISGPEKTFEQ
jgi:hypothetical protein